MTRWLAAFAVLVVAVIAALISFGHIESVALTYGQTLLAARLLPVSADGTIVAASMVLLDAARRSVPAPVLGRVMLGLGVTATLGANAVSGAGHGRIGVVVAMLPAVFFIGSVEVLLGMIRVRSQAAHEGVSETAQTVAETAREAPSRRALSRRGTEDMMRYLRLLAEAGADVRSLKDPWLHTLDPLARELLVGVFSTLARYESQRRSDRIRAGLARRKAEGLPVGRQPGAMDKGQRRRSGYVASWETGGARRAAQQVPPGKEA